MASYTIEGTEWQRVKMLGKGSFGEAYLVKAVGTGEQAVVKLVHTQSMSKKERDEARNEVAVLSKLRHPNIVAYLGSHESGGTLHILMEYCNSGDLEGLIKKQRGIPIPEETVSSLFIQMSQAVKYLHERRILHRDLKTQNVFLTQSSPSAPLVAKLGDFGISTVLRNTLALAKTVCGTPYYFSPELCQSKPYNNKSDIWSLGCIFYELCTLKHAFDAQNLKALMARILKGTYLPISSTTYSPAAQLLVEGMLQQRSSKRFCIQQVLGSEFVQRHTQRMNADHTKSLSIRAEQVKELSAREKAKAKPMIVKPSQQRKPSIDTDNRIEQARKKRELIQRADYDKRMAKHRRDMQRGFENLDDYHRKLRQDRNAPVERRYDLEKIDDIRNRIELRSYEEQQPYIEQGWRAVQDVKLRQDARQKDYDERDRHLAMLQQQINAIGTKPRPAPPSAPLPQQHLPPVDHGIPQPPPAPYQQPPQYPEEPQYEPSPPEEEFYVPEGSPQPEPSARTLAKAYKNRVSEDAPWNRNRDVPVGFSAEGWSKHQQVMHRFGAFGESPSDGRGGQQLPAIGGGRQLSNLPAHTVRPDPVFGGEKDLEEVDVDGLLKAEEDRLAQDPKHIEMVEQRRQDRAMEEAQRVWMERQQAIRKAQGIDVKPGASEAEVMWALEQKKIRDANNNRQVVQPPPPLPPQEEYYPEDDEYGAVPLDEYDDAMWAMNAPSDMPEPPEMFEEAALPANDITRASNMAKFTLDGRTLQLPNARANDPLPLRVEGLRMYLTEALGGPRNYQYLHKQLSEIQSADVPDETADMMLSSLEKEFGEKARYVDLMIQMMVCETML